VYGNAILSSLYPNYGAVAIHTASNGPKGGIMDIRSINGGIIAIDRAFDNASKKDKDAKIYLHAMNNIGLSATSKINDGASDNKKAVVSVQGGFDGDGGTNTLRSYSGSIAIHANAQVLADSWIDSRDGRNLLTSCVGVIRDGIVDPADANIADDSGVSIPSMPDPIFDSDDLSSGGILTAPPVISMNREPDKISVSRSYLGLSYPNPFNPETWIPYQLANNTDVTIRIYNASGLLVKTLNLGDKPSGLYTSKDKAAYWDGMNESGEQVSSGIYFYNIQAGEYTATRKMLMLK